MRNSKQRLFEMMNRVAGMPVLKESSSDLGFPPGISLKDDFMPLEDYIKQVPCGVNEDIPQTNPNDFGAKLTPVPDVKKMLAKKDAEIASKHQDYNTGGRIHAGTLNAVRKGDDFDVEELKKILKQVPNNKQFLNQNGKMGKSNFYNVTLPAFKGLLYNQTDDKFYVVSVCSKAGECTRDCYAQMGRYIMFDNTVRLNTQKLNYLLNHWEEWRDRMISTIKTMSWGGGSVIRWHDSGDFLSEKYLQIAFEVAKATPNDFHYAYTKEVSMVQKSQIPDNFEFKFSYGGKEDHLINPKAHGYAVIVPEELFKDLQPQGAGENWNFTPESIETLKDRIAEKYKLDRNIVITNDELAQIPYNPKDKHERKWCVVTWSGKNDIPALRKDVLGMYNLKHR